MIVINIELELMFKYERGNHFDKSGDRRERGGSRPPIENPRGTALGDALEAALQRKIEGENQKSK